jgi:hypothetical protein
MKTYLNAEKTYGYITKLNRELLELPKEHYMDAVVIASSGLPVKPCKEVYYKKEVSCCDRILTRGKRSEKRIPVGKILGIRKIGAYNMFTQGSYVAERMGIDLDTYFQLLWNYDKLKEEVNADKG